MAAMGPGDRAGAGPDGTAVCPSGPQACLATTRQDSARPDMQGNLMYMQCCGQGERAVMGSGRHKSLAAPLQTVAPTIPLCNVSATAEAPYSFRSPESVEMDEIMAAMVLTSLSCSPVVQSPPQADPGPAGSSTPADMECGGGELSDSGSSGCWSWDHGSVSPAASPSVTEMDSSPDEGLHMELEQGEELSAKKPKSSFRAVYRCLWPSCGKVLTSSVGIKRHIRVLHLGGSEQSQREEDFYYTKISCETVDAASAPAPSQHAPGQASSPHLCWASCGSPPGLGHQIPLASRPRSNSSSGPGPGRPSPLSQSAPSSFWQIHSEHLYQVGATGLTATFHISRDLSLPRTTEPACSPVQVSLASPNPGSQGWTPSVSVSGHNSTPMVKPRCRSVSVGEQWLQQNSATSRLQTMSASPSRSHCSFRKGRGEAKKCRKVYGVERKDQWCTACRWKKACQRFPD